MKMNREHFAKAVEFGSTLLITRDLDPVYVAMTALPKAEQPRALLAYSCLYHLGAAGYLGTLAGEAFWERLAEAARNRAHDWPRGTERRHWRGDTATRAVEWLRGTYGKPENAVFSWYWATPQQKFGEVALEVRKAHSFGPWIAFKVADMLDRVLGLRVDFSACELGIYRDPAYGAALLAYGVEEHPADTNTLRAVIAALLASPLRKFKAPPAMDRPINVQEIETILCKYKSHVHGHYPLGKDTREVYHGLCDKRWGARAETMRRALEPFYTKYWRQHEA